MTTDDLLLKLPSHIGWRGNYEWLHLINSGKGWEASYGVRGEYLCLNPESKKPPYNNAVAYGDTPNEALQGLYDWCVRYGFIK